MTDTTAKIRERLAVARKGLEHAAPESCWSTGPNTGDPIEDYIVCPGCRGLRAIDEALALLDAERPSGWISVEARLPEERETVLGTGLDYGKGPSRHCEVVEFASGFFARINAEDEGVDDRPYITHWMPLPSPPDVKETP